MASTCAVRRWTFMQSPSLPCYRAWLHWTEYRKLPSISPEWCAPWMICSFHTTLAKTEYMHRLSFINEVLTPGAARPGDVTSPMGLSTALAAETVRVPPGVPVLPQRPPVPGSWMRCAESVLGLLQGLLERKLCQEGGLWVLKRQRNESFRSKAKRRDNISFMDELMEVCWVWGHLWDPTNSSWGILDVGQNFHALSPWIENELSKLRFSFRCCFFGFFGGATSEDA